jgi:predicted ArsR family transcriptional regulator
VHAVRKRILEILKEGGGATVADLANELEMAPVSVRHHLDVLQGDNLICVERLERKGNVGRPQQIYGLTPAANDYFPNNFAALAEGLVCQIKAVLPPDKVQHAFQALASEIAAELNTSTLESASPEERLALVCEFLTEHGYLARWEPVDSDQGDNGKGDTGKGEYLLHKYNCPYAGVSDTHQELCMMDQALVDRLVGQPCQRVQSMVENGHCCTYRIELTDVEHRVENKVENKVEHKTQYADVELERQQA